MGGGTSHAENGHSGNGLRNLIDEIKKEKSENFKAVKTYEKEKKDHRMQSNFPHVEIHYKKAEKMT